MVRRFAVCVLVGALGLGAAPRPATAAPARVVTGSHYRCMYHCDQRAHLFEDTPRFQKSGRRSLAQTTTTQKSTFCQRAAPDPTNPLANSPTLADKMMSWLYSVFCTSPTAQPAPAPMPPVVPPPVVPPPPAPAPQPPPPTTGKPGPWWPFPSTWPNSHGPSWWNHDGWDGDDHWEHRKWRDHDDDDRWEHRKKRDHDDDDRWEHRKHRHHDDDDRWERRKQRDRDDRR